MVDVYATLIFVDVSGDSYNRIYPVLPPRVVPSYPGLHFLVVPTPVTTMQPDGSEWPQVTTQKVIQEALVVEIQEEFVTLAVSSPDAVTLTWLVEASVPITFVLTDE